MREEPMNKLSSPYERQQFYIYSQTKSVPPSPFCRWGIRERESRLVWWNCTLSSVCVCCLHKTFTIHSYPKHSRVAACSAVLNFNASVLAIARIMRCQRDCFRGCRLLSRWVSTVPSVLSFAAAAVTLLHTELHSTDTNTNDNSFYC